MSEHARFSPSASTRWMACPASIPLSENLCAGSSEHNFFSASGTVCHAIGEQVLRAVFLDNTDYRPILDRAYKNTWACYAEMPDVFASELVTSEMIEQIEVYLFNAREIIDEGDKVYLEKRVRYSDDLFGTVDLIVEKPGKLVICDLKTGSGVMVSSWENKQLLTYAALYMGDRDDLPAVELTIIQPPAEIAMNTYITDYKAVKQHMAEIKRVMELAKKYDDKHLHTGDHCRWCSVRASCPEIHRVASCAMTTNLDGLTPEKWSEILNMAEVLKPWCQSVFDRAHQLVEENGLKIPGKKLVRKVGRKTWQSEKEAGFALTEALDDAGVDLLDSPKLFNDPKLRTPTQLKKELKGVIDTEFIEGLTSIPARGTILVPKSDKRDEIATTDHGKIAKSLEAFVNINSAK